MQIQDIEKLAKLARIELSQGEKQTYLKEIGAILGYVDQIKEVVAKVAPTSEVGVPTRFGTGVGRDLRNVMREDAEPNESGGSTAVLVKEFPRKEGNYLKVKKILEQ